MPLVFEIVSSFEIHSFFNDLVSKKSFAIFLKKLSVVGVLQLSLKVWNDQSCQKWRLQVNEVFLKEPAEALLNVYYPNHNEAPSEKFK